MKSPKQYCEWLDRIKEEIDYDVTDEASFEIEKSNYKILHSVYKKMTDNVDDALSYATMYNQLLGKHMKFLENYGLNGSAKLRNQYLKKKVESVEGTIEEKDALDIFIAEH